MSRRPNLVHLAGPDDALTACGKVALLDDGTRLLETDTREYQLSCKTCLRLAERATKEKPNG